MIISIRVRSLIFAAMVLAVFGISMLLSPHSVVPAAKADPSAAQLYQLWNGNAYFERQVYGADTAYDEAAPIARPDLGANVIYLYYRDHGPNNLNDGIGIGLAVSNDGGATFNVKSDATQPVVPLGGYCDFDNKYVVSPSVIEHDNPDGSRKFYMVYEGATENACLISTGKVFAATSTDGVSWSKAGIILLIDPGCNNVGTPFVGYFNGQFYVFYHQACPLGLVDARSKVMMASGPDLAHLTKHGMIMDIGVGNQAWDSRVNSRASVISEYDNTGTLYYYVTFEGSQNVYCSSGNWGWGIARTTNIDSGPWQKFQYNPIRQTYNAGCGNDIPYIFRFNNVIRVFQHGLGLSNVLLQGTTSTSSVGPKGVTLIHPGGDPYLYVFPARSQCLAYNDGIGRLDGDGISWSVNTIQDTTHSVYMCKGPQHNQLPAGNFAVDFNLWIDVNTCGSFPCEQVMGLDFFNEATSTTFTGASNEQQITRNQFIYAQTFQSFHNQFSASASTGYDWRTYWVGNSYLKQSNVVLRYLDGIDTSPPTTSMSQLPAYSPSPISVSWSGSDPDSGIWYFDTQYNDVTAGSGWQPLLSLTNSLSTNFNGLACHTYQFQARARDYAGNLQSFANTAQASTTVLCGMTVSSSPASVVADGASTSTVTVQTQDNAQGRVVSFSTTLGALSASSCTTGTGGSCGVTIKSNSYGIATVTATATGYSSSSTTVAFTDFGISGLPNPLNINAGSTGTWTITVNSLQGFTGTVTLTDTVPTGLTCSALSPSTISLTSTSTSGTSNLSCSGGAVGTYNVNVNGTSGKLLHTTTLTANIGDFSISASPQIQTVNAGTKATSAVTLNPINGFSGTVNLSVSTGAASCSINPASVSIPLSGTSTLLCSASTTGRYSITVTGSSGSLTRSTFVRLVVGLAYNFQDNFTYASISQMSNAGWNFNTPSQASVGGGSLTLVNNGIAGSQATWANVTSGVGNWTVAARAEWVGGPYGTLQVNAFTARHSYAWHVDGYFNQYVFYRDGQTAMRINGYNPAMNVWHTLRIDMLNGKISLYFDSSLITTYTETDPGTSLTQFGPAAGWESTDSYTFMQANLLKFTLTLQGYDYNQAQEETLTLNGQLLAQLPTIYTKANTKTYATFSLDMTSLFVRGTNTLTFTHANTDCKVVDSTTNVQITDANGAIILSDLTVRPLSCTQSITYTFTI